MKYRLFVLFVGIMIAFSYSKSQAQSIYYGIGGGYFMPQKTWSEVNKEAFGLKLEVTAKTYCKLWYGLRVDYFKLDKKEELTQNYFTNSLFISPEIKYAPFVKDCFDNKFIPYLQGMLTFSSITGTDEAPKLALGLAGGVGIAYNFKLFETCWMLDLDGLYSAPNGIFRANKRKNLQSILVSLTLSAAL